MFVMLYKVYDLCIMLNYSIRIILLILRFGVVKSRELNIGF